MRKRRRAEGGPGVGWPREAAPREEVRHRAEGAGAAGRTEKRESQRAARTDLRSDEVKNRLRMGREQRGPGQWRWTKRGSDSERGV